MFLHTYVRINVLMDLCKNKMYLLLTCIHTLDLFNTLHTKIHVFKKLSCKQISREYFKDTFFMVINSRNKKETNEVQEFNT